MIIRDMIIGIIIVVLVMTSGAMVIQSMKIDYNPLGGNLSDELLTNFTSSVDSTYQTIEGMKNDTTRNDLVADQEVWDSSIKGSYVALKKTIGLVDDIGNMINDVGIRLGIPPFILTIATVIVFVTLIFGIIYLVFRFRS